MNNTTTELINDMTKDISFDGMFLWLSDAKIGEVSDQCQMQCPVDKETLDNEKRVMLGRIIGEV